MASEMSEAIRAFVELDTNTTEKLLYSYDGDNKRLDIQDATEAVDDVDIA